MNKTQRYREASRRLFLADLGRWAGPALGAVAMLAIVVWLSTRPKNRVSFDAAAESICRADYARARTFADTQMVDLRVPVVTRVRATTGVTCGVIRQSARAQR
jgi:hypothetical protein